MDISGEYRIDASRARVWAALNDPEVLQACIPGCEAIEKISSTEMLAVVTAAIGPVKAKFKTRIELQNLNPPESYTLSGDAKAGATGFGRG
ncbi:MAG: carbon monoxide dehydrogenase subunit G, partial [Woeseia sp.]